MVKYSKIRARHLKKMSFEKLADQLRSGGTPGSAGPMRTLISAVSALEGILILSSCGGRIVPEGEPVRSQEGDFFIVFFVKPSAKGFRSLGILVEAASNIDPDHVWVKVENMTDNPDFINFELHGTNEVSPDDLAEEIRSLHDLFSKPPGIWKFLSKEYFHE